MFILCDPPTSVVKKKQKRKQNNRMGLIYAQIIRNQQYTCSVKKQCGALSGCTLSLIHDRCLCGLSSKTTHIIQVIAYKWFFSFSSLSNVKLYSHINARHSMYQTRRRKKDFRMFWNTPKTAHSIFERRLFKDFKVTFDSCLSNKNHWIFIG